METLPYNKCKNVVKKVKKAFKTRWLNLHASVDGVYEEYVGLLETFSILETEGGSITLSKIIPNIEKMKPNLQQILDEQKPLMLLKADMKNRLQRCNMKVDERVEEKRKNQQHDRQKHKGYITEC